jgi:hypothetical protein
MIKYEIRAHLEAEESHRAIIRQGKLPMQGSISLLIHFKKDLKISMRKMQLNKKLEFPKRIFQILQTLNKKKT